MKERGSAMAMKRTEEGRQVWRKMVVVYSNA